jgi:hypothetical protein
MEHLFAVPYSPWTNGAVERAGGIALELLRAVCISGKGWQCLLPACPSCGCGRGRSS